MVLLVYYQFVVNFFFFFCLAYICVTFFVTQVIYIYIYNYCHIVTIINSKLEIDHDILKNICGVNELSSPGPLHTGPKAHAEEEETPKDEQRKSKFPRDIVEDNPVLSQSRS